MIKVIRHGTIKRVFCEKCGCLFTYEQEDVNSVQVDYNEHKTFVICPDCGEEVKCVPLGK